MGQLAIVSKSSIIDFDGQPGPPSNPPVSQARMFYDLSNDTFHVIDSQGHELLTGGSGGSLPPGSVVDGGTY